MLTSYGEPVGDAIEQRWRPEIARLRIPSLGSLEAELLATLAAASGARRVLELGTAIGYSTAYLATGVGPEGNVTAVELSAERAAVARHLWTEAGLEERIELREGDALEIVPSLAATFDLVFVDLLWELGRHELGAELARHVTRVLRVGGVLVADNCGQQLPAADGFIQVVREAGFQTQTVLPLRDGMLVAVR